jgi:hypothetical protein
MKAPAGELHERLAAELDVPQPRIRVRVLLYDDDQAFGVNWAPRLLQPHVASPRLAVARVR